MTTTRKPPQIIIALLALFCLAMVATTATAKDIEWKNKKLEFVDYNGKKCLRAEGYYFNSSGGRVITGINAISFTWKETRNGETRDGSATFDDPPFHARQNPFDVLQLHRGKGLHWLHGCGTGVCRQGRAGNRGNGGRPGNGSLPPQCGRKIARHVAP